MAIVGIGLEYRDADSPDLFWENVLSGRRAFRRLPDERMNAEDYCSADHSAPDRFYARRAAVLRDYSFDRARFRVAGSTFRTTDMTHWLALNVAERALADAGFAGGESLPRRRTGVVVGNSLTGEFARANMMRVRWPYVRRTVAVALTEQDWTPHAVAGFLPDLEVRYKEPFPEVDEDTLAGGLASTIAGRICNVFDLAGGGYTVDGACSSSLRAVTTSAAALVDGSLDVALAAGVDLSIDPFEVIGFAKTGALASGEIKIYDRGSNGFWPGEGCGMVVLMRESDALARGLRIYATVTGWGVSSDGKGGITRPEAEGHRLAIRRAYERAGYGVETVSYFEGHGTGTALGDATEIEVIAGARREAGPAARPAALSSVKGNTGNTKAAAGIAGLIKAVLAVHHQVVPPATGHVDPHPLLLKAGAPLVVPTEAGTWPRDLPMRAGVSAMGFGGIKSHIAISETPGVRRRSGLDRRTDALVASRQDAELLVLDAPDADALAAKVAALRSLLPRLSMAEVGDLAAALASGVGDRPVRAAVVAHDPDEADCRLATLQEWLAAGVTRRVGVDGISLAGGTAARRIGFLFPGQGSGHARRSTIARRFPGSGRAVRSRSPEGADLHATEFAQPRIVGTSLEALAVLTDLGVEASVAVGHSLGELIALCWGGAIEDVETVALARARPRARTTAMAGLGPGGAMASLELAPDEAEALCAGGPVVVAGYNGPHSTVVSGPGDALDAVVARATSRGVTASRLPVSHAFHSPMVAPAADALVAELDGVAFTRLARPVVSTFTGEVLHAGEDLRELLVTQVTAPVRFREAATTVAASVDLLIDAGPGRVLTGLLAGIAPQVPTLAVDADNASLAPLLAALGAAFAMGTPLDLDALFDGRTRRVSPAEVPMSFLASPCATGPALDGAVGALISAAGVEPAATASAAGAAGAAASSPDPAGAGTLELLRRVVAERAELPVEAVQADTHPLDDLHLSSITVGQIANEITSQLGCPPLPGMSNLAVVDLGELAEMIDELDGSAGGGERTSEVNGVGDWVRPFAATWEPAGALPAAPRLAGVAAAWTVVAHERDPLATSLGDALRAAGLGEGVLLCLPVDGGPRLPELGLAAAQEVIARPNGTRFVVVQSGLGVPGLARTLRLEDPSAPVTVVDLVGPRPVDAVDVAATVELVLAEVAATTTVSESSHDGAGGRRVPRLRAVVPESAAQHPAPLGVDDVLLVTGGGKGITAECALALAVDSGAALALVGRSDPAADEELGGYLSRMAAAGVRVQYVRADVSDRGRTAAAVAEVEAVLGPVTAILHGAGRNEPGALYGLDVATFERALQPKVGGLTSVLAAVDADCLWLLVGFGRIIGRAGLRGEGHYATAIDPMTELVRRFGEDHPHVRTLSLEWSVWSGVGMGEKLGVVEALQRDGIVPISTDVGIEVLRGVLADPASPGTLVVSGRTGGLETLPAQETELPLRRFVDRVAVHYPGIELVTETELSSDRDPYLDDHDLDGDLLFPAVVGMEAMTQVAKALVGRGDAPTMTGVEFLRPIVVPSDGSTTSLIAPTGGPRSSARRARCRRRTRAGSPSSWSARPPGLRRATGVLGQRRGVGRAARARPGGPGRPRHRRGTGSGPVAAVGGGRVRPQDGLDDHVAGPGAGARRRLVSFTVGDLRVATWRTRVVGWPGPLLVAVLEEKSSAGEG